MKTLAARRFALGRCSLPPVAVVVVVACTAPAAVGSEGSDPRRSGRGMPTECEPQALAPDADGTQVRFTDISVGTEVLGFTYAPPNVPQEVTGVSDDLDGDGRMEVIVSLAQTMEPAQPAALVFTYDMETKSFVPFVATGIPSGAGVMAAADLDSDGHEDLVLTGSAQIAWGRGNGVFVVLDDPPANSEIVGSASLDDVDDDGWLDLVTGVADSRCHALRVALRTSPRAFEASNWLVPADLGTTTNVALSTQIPGVGHVLAALGYACFGSPAPMLARAHTLDADGYPAFAVYDPVPAGVSLCAGMDTVSIENVPRYIPMGAALGDLDGDGALDLLVTTHRNVLLRGHDDGTFTDETEARGASATALSDTGRRMLPWGAGLVDLDGDGHPDLVAVNGPDAPGTTSSYDPGPQFVTVSRNDGTGHLHAVQSGRTGVSQRGGWRSLDVTDLDGDGHPDLIASAIATQRPPAIYRNENVANHHALSITLHGTTSNALGLGARVEVQVQAGGPTQLLFVGNGFSPAVFPHAIVFAGLGDAARASLVRVRWPSGTVQELHDVAGDRRLAITEPTVLAVSPAARHVAPDGTATATVRVTPRDANGAVISAQNVTARALGTTVRLAVTHDDRGWLVTATAPASEGSTAIEVSIDGVKVGVRPRIWWDSR